MKQFIKKFIMEFKMKQFINAASGSVGAFLVLLALFPAPAVSQTVVAQSQSFPQVQSNPQVQVYSQPQAYPQVQQTQSYPQIQTYRYPQVQRYQQVQNYPQVQNHARTQAYPQLDTPQQAVAANSVASSAPKNYSGTWRLSLSAEQQQQRQAAIESAVSGFGRFQQGKARQAMDRMTSPENQLRIVDSGNQIKMTRMGREVTIALNGQPVAVNLGQRNASMQATKRDGKLVVVSSMANAKKTTTYELSADGRQLKQTVDMSGGRLPTPIQYSSTYIR